MRAQYQVLLILYYAFLKAYMVLDWISPKQFIILCCGYLWAKTRHFFKWWGALPLLVGITVGGGGGGA